MFGLRFPLIILVSLSAVSCSLISPGELKSFSCSAEGKDDKGLTAVYQYNKSKNEITWISVKYPGKEEQVKGISASAYKVDNNLMWKFPPEGELEDFLYGEINYFLNTNTMKMKTRYGKDKVYEFLLSCKRI